MTETIDGPSPERPLGNPSSRETPQAPGQGVEAYLAPLPPETQEALREFFVEVAKTVASQHTRVLPDDRVEIRVPPQDVAFYKDRFAEIREAHFFNPRLPVRRRIA